MKIPLFLPIQDCLLHVSTSNTFIITIQRGDGSCSWGIGSDDSKYLLSLMTDYRAAGKKVQYRWKRMKGSRRGTSKGSNKSHVKRVMKRKAATFLPCGKSAWNNLPRAGMIRWLSPVALYSAYRTCVPYSLFAFPDLEPRYRHRRHVISCITSLSLFPYVARLAFVVC